MKKFWNKKINIILGVVVGVSIVIIICMKFLGGFPVLKYQGVRFEIGDYYNAEKFKNHFPSVTKGQDFWNLDGYLSYTVSIETEENDDVYYTHPKAYRVVGWRIDGEAKDASVNGIEIGDSDVEVLVKFRKAIKEDYQVSDSRFDDDDVDKKFPYRIVVYFDEKGNQISDPGRKVWQTDGLEYYKLVVYISEDGKVKSMSFSDTGSN